jgi:hypothetical protein
MADELEGLKAQVALLTRRNTRLIAENTRRKKQNRDLQAQFTSLNQEKTQSRDAEPTRSKPQKTTPMKGNQELESLRAEVRAYKHQTSLSQLAYGKEIGLNQSVPIDRLMRLIDYKPVSDQFDKKAVKEMLLDLKQSDPYLFAEESTETPSSKRTNGVAPVSRNVSALGNAFGRGTSPSPSEQQPLSDEQLRSPTFMAEYNRKQREGMKK